MSLAEWHDRLETHFHKLYQERSKEVSRPVFALEHDFSGQELGLLKQEVRAYIKKGQPNNKLWLPWIVYAAELGYEYIGYEYWQTFEESTDGWLQYGNRYFLSEQFKKFCNNFGGARPSGLWAKHRTIICYPITHAVLPKDFQRQLARVLYETRRQFTDKVLQSPEQLGQLIAANSSEQRDRFRRFVQNVDLVGLIAKGLLAYQEQDSSTILLPSTLQRIIKDLEFERNARDWLSDARKYAARATERRGLTTHQITGSLVPDSPRERTTTKAKIIEPELILRQVAQDRWEVLLKVPDFSPLLADSPTLRSFLTSSRSTIRGADSKHRFARGQLFSYGAQEVPLRTFPPNGVALLQFEGAVPGELHEALDADFRLSANEITLCRIATDGRAYQMHSLLVRPQRQYIILSTKPIKPNPLCRTIHVTCSGISAAYLRMPEYVTDEHRDCLEDLGLTVAKKVCVSPAGFVAAGWDGEGRGEWLADETPCVVISTDHSIHSFQLELDGDKSNSLEVAPPESNSPLFVELPLLCVGTHSLRVASRPRVDNRYEELGHLEVVIKEPRTWKPGVNNQGALIVLTDPRLPSLEQLWESRVSVEMHGPMGHSVKCVATFLGKDSGMPALAPKTLFTLQLPVKPDVWKKQINEQLKSKAIQKAVEQAYACRLDFDAGELGIFSINCERELNPLRWVVERDANTYILSLLDDSSGEDSIDIIRYDLTKPNTPIPLKPNGVLRKYPVPPTGGLYVARSHQAECSVVVPHQIPSEFRAFSELRSMEFVMQFCEGKRDVRCLTELIGLYRLWLGARTTGSAVAEWAQGKVLRALLTQIFKVICDKSWMAAETSFASNPTSYGAIQNFSSAACGSPPLLQGLASFCQRTVGLTPECRAEQLTSIMGNLIPPIELPDSPSIRTAKGVRVIKSKRASWQVQFALRLASAPETVQDWSGSWYEAGLRALLNNKVLARVARFLVLTAHHRQVAHYPSYTSLYAGWEWS